MLRLKESLAVGLIALVGLVAVGMGVVLVATTWVMGAFIVLAARIGMSARTQEHAELRRTQETAGAVF